MKLIDIHNHKPTGKEDRIEVKVFNTYQSVEETPHYFCISAHPWFLEDFNYEEFTKSIKTHRKNPLFFAMGEIGLDRKKGIAYSKQMNLFEKLVQFAKESRIPRLVIHSVKTAEDVYKVIHQSRYSGQIIFHDYNENEQITQKLLKINSYFSFGNNLLKDNAKAQKIFSLIPRDRIFFESDDSDILELAYKKGAEISGIDFKKICQDNFNRLLN